MSRARRFKIITNKPARSIVFDNLLRILKLLTDCVWGYVKNRRTIRYVTSYEIPIKVGIIRNKSYERLYSQYPDILINNTSPYIFESKELWDNALTAEVQIKLLRVIGNEAIRARILQWKPYGEYAEMLIEAAEQNAKYTTNTNLYDVWRDSI